MQEAIANAETTAQQFAKNSHSKLDKIVSADQGQFSIEDRDSNTPYIKKVRVVTTVTYSLKDWARSRQRTSTTFYFILRGDNSHFSAFYV